MHAGEEGTSSGEAALDPSATAAQSGTDIRHDDEQRYEEVDSAYGDASYIGTEESSLASSIGKYRTENGRTYHSYGSFEHGHWGPNDEKAQDQQDLSHHLWTLALQGKHFLAPIFRPSKILDIGTGTGIWVLDVAEQFPQATVYGSDLSPIQPTWVPPNVFFEVDDYNLPWVDTDTSKYDFIHARELLGTAPDWVSLYRQALTALKPGGYFEQHEPNLFFQSDVPDLEDDHPFTQWGQLMIEAGQKSNARFDIAPHLKEWMEEAGFINVTQRKMKLHIGGWSSNRHDQTIGNWNQLRLDEGISDFCSRRFHNQMGLSSPEIQVFCARLRAAFRDKALRGYQWAYFVYGQRPETSAE